MDTETNAKCTKIMETLPPLPDGAVFEPTKLETIALPHPYIIGARHVAHASNHFGGILSKTAIEDGEKRGIMCEMRVGRIRRRCHLKLHEHKNPLTLYIAVPEQYQRDLNACPLLRHYLLAIKEANLGIEGFAFPAL